MIIVLRSDSSGTLFAPLVILAARLIGDIVVNHLGYQFDVRDTPW